MKHIPYLDFIKGFAILAVIFLHCLPNEQIGAIVHIGQAVPLFLLISSVLTFCSPSHTVLFEIEMFLS